MVLTVNHYLVLQDYFKTIMAEEPPEFFQRPRNTSQQATSGRPEFGGDQPKLKYGSGSGTNSYGPVSDLSGAGGSGFPSMPLQNAYDSVTFGEFDDVDAEDENQEDAHVQQAEKDVAVPSYSVADDSMSMQIDHPQPKPQIPASASTSQQIFVQPQPPQQMMQSHYLTGQYPGQHTQGSLSTSPQPHMQPSGYQQTQLQQPIPLQSQYIPIPQPGNMLAPGMVPKQSASPVPQGRTPKLVARLVEAAKPPRISSFAISLSGGTVKKPLLRHQLANSLVRQHTLTLSREVDNVEIVPLYSTGGAAATRAAIRPQQLIMEGITSDEERARGAMERKWIIKPSRGLTVFEMTVGDDEVYRLFLSKLSI